MKEKKNKSSLRRRMSVYISGMLLALMILTGCSFSAIEGVSAVPLAGGGLGRVMLNIATLPAEWSHSLLEPVLDTSFVDTIATSIKLSNSDALFKNSTSGGVNLGNLWKYINKVYETLKPVGIALCTTFFIISLLSLATRDNTTLEHFIKEIIKFMVAVAVLANITTIFNLMMNIGDHMAETANKATFTIANGKDSKALVEDRWKLLLGSGSTLSGMSMEESGDYNLMVNGKKMFEFGDGMEAILHFSLNSSSAKTFNYIAGSSMISGGSKLDSTGAGNPFTPLESAGTYNGSAEDWMKAGSSDWREVYLNLATLAICTKASANGTDDSITGYGMLGAMGNWYSCLGVILVLAIISVVARVAAYFALIQRLLDIAWRVVFSPIGAADMFSGTGTSSPGVRYMKGFFGACASGVLLIVVLKIGFSVSNNFLQNICTNYTSSALIISAIAMRLATIGCAMGASSKVKEIMG